MGTLCDLQRWCRRPCRLSIGLGPHLEQGRRVEDVPTRYVSRSDACPLLRLLTLVTVLPTQCSLTTSGRPTKSHLRSALPLVLVPVRVPAPVLVLARGHVTRMVALCPSSLRVCRCPCCLPLHCALAPRVILTVGVVPVTPAAGPVVPVQSNQRRTRTRRCAFVVWLAGSYLLFLTPTSRSRKSRTREFKSLYVVKVGSHIFHLLHRMEGRWNGEATTIPADDESVRVCAVECTSFARGCDAALVVTPFPSHQ